MKTYVSLFGILFLALLIFSCVKEPISSEEIKNENHEFLSQFLDIPPEPYNYTPQPPLHAGPFAHNANDKFLHPAQIKLRNYKARMGRALFYDTRLSANNTVSCASCHSPEFGFADNAVVSKGFLDQSGTRNSLALGNTIGFEFAYGAQEALQLSSAKFGWDDTVEDMKEQIKLALTSPIEMGLTMQEVVNRVKNDEMYQVLFSEASGKKEIDEDFILVALESFVNSIIASDTKFDRELNKLQRFDPNKDFEGFTDEENMGKAIFNRDCSSCHGKSHTGVIVASANNGLDIKYNDRGKGEKTNFVEDNGIFKVPFLRNVSITSPYMHDGRFATLEEVIDHYSSSIQDHLNLSPQLKTGNGPKKFNYTTTEKNALIAYLHSLTDESIQTLDKYSDPFIR